MLVWNKIVTNTSSYNYYRKNLKIFCSEHKEGGMVNMTVTNICEYPECDIMSDFSFPGVRQPKRCNGHKENGVTKSGPD